MWAREVHELDVVRLKDGRKGTVVCVYDVPGLPLMFEIEFEDGELETVSPGDVQEVVWRFRALHDRDG